MTKLHSQIFEY